MTKSLENVKITDLPTELVDLVTNALNDALEDFNTGQMPDPVFYVGSTQDKRIVRIPIDTQNKDLTAAMVKMAADHMDADFIINIFEAWILTRKNEDVKDKIMDMEGSISNHPDRETVLFCNVETYDKVYTTQIPEGSIMQVENVEFYKSTGSEGRFTRLLPNHPKRTVH